MKHQRYKHACRSIGDRTLQTTDKIHPFNTLYVDVIIPKFFISESNIVWVDRKRLSQLIISKPYILSQSTSVFFGQVK